MFEYEKLGKQYGATVTVNRGLQIISVPTQSTVKVDVGFGVGQGNLLSSSFPFFRRHSFGSNLFVFGDRAIALSQRLTNDDHLCSALQLVLENYAYSLEWNGAKLTARINTQQGFPSNDGTGGARFFSALKMIADHLSSIDARTLGSTTTEHTSWGPGRVRKIILASAFALPAVGYWGVRFWATHFLLHH